MGKKKGGKKKDNVTQPTSFQKKAPKLPPVRTGARKHSPAPSGRRGR